LGISIRCLLVWLVSGVVRRFDAELAGLGVDAVAELAFVIGVGEHLGAGAEPPHGLVVGERLDAVAELADVPIVGLGLLAFLEAAGTGLLGCGRVVTVLGQCVSLIADAFGADPSRGVPLRRAAGRPLRAG